MVRWLKRHIGVMTRDGITGHSVRVLAVCVMMLATSAAHGQVLPYDFAGIEQLISHHKSLRSRHLARATIAETNRVMADYCATAHINYEAIEADLENYTKAFDIIDLVASGFVTVLNIKDCIDRCNASLQQMTTDISTYVNVCVKNKNLNKSDTLILGLFKRCGEGIAADSKELYLSLTSVLLGATGKFSVTTESMMSTLNIVNDGMFDITLRLERCALAIHCYIMSRTHYFKEDVWVHTTTTKEKCDSALARWRRFAREALKKKH